MGSKLSAVPLNASTLIAVTAWDKIAKPWASYSASAATAQDIAVPLMIASLSFGFKLVGSSLVCAKVRSAVSLGSDFEKIRTVRLPWSAPAMYDSGLRSPDAEMLPRRGITGMISCFNRSFSR